MADGPASLRSRAAAALVLTCEHASHAVPDICGDLGLSDEQRRDHIGWDVGAALVTDELSKRLAAPAVLSSVSRLVVDCNRSLADHDLIPDTSHGVPIPANRSLDTAERARRLRAYYDPFHDEVDRALALSENAKLLSVHSFTPHYDGRDFDIGVLFDDYEDHAEELANELRSCGLRVRMNEPYSGLDGLIFSARLHGRRFGRPYLELEINNALLRSEGAVRALVERISAPVATYSRR